MNTLFSRWGDWSGVEHHEDPVCPLYSHLHGPAALQGESACLWTTCFCCPAADQFTFSDASLSVSSQEAASLSMEAGLGGGRSLLQARGGYRERERERERQRRIKEKAGIYSPVEFKVEWLFFCACDSCLVLFLPRHKRLVWICPVGLLLSEIIDFDSVPQNTVLLPQILTRASNVDSSAAENSPQQMHYFLLFE